MADDIVLTPSAKRKIEDELRRLREVEMPDLSERIRQARDLGDLSENFDYQDAKRQQGFVSGRIADLQAMLDRGKVVEEIGPGSDVVGMGSVVRVRDLDYDDEFSVKLVSPNEANGVDAVSSLSPIGKALMNRKVGDKIAVETPDGKTTFEILTIE
ncbi:MAG: transcription elongation factor GreA [Capsulimonadales bacterium]|nr:transcription elongation factor GreA [Capsulimonadales bacterium]